MGTQAIKPWTDLVTLDPDGRPQNRTPLQALLVLLRLARWAVKPKRIWYDVAQERCSRSTQRGKRQHTTVHQ